MTPSGHVLSIVEDVGN